MAEAFLESIKMLCFMRCRMGLAAGLWTGTSASH
jgi:hypothetical protein